MTWRLSFLLFTFFLSVTLVAQDLPELSTTGDEVVVTGSRTPRLIENTTAKVTVIDSATIARNYDLGQLLNEQAGIVVNGVYSAPGKDRSIFLRNGANQYTLILLDGQPLIDPSSLGGAVDLRLLDLRSIERIEIIRGAQSLIYGSDAVAGVINLISKNSGQKGHRVNLLASAGSFDTYEGAANANGSSDEISYSAGINYLTSGGFSEALPNLSSGPGGSSPERDGARRLNGFASVAFYAGEHWTVNHSLRYSSFNGDYDGGAFMDNDQNTYDNDLINPSLAIDFQKTDYSAGVRYNYVATDRLFSTEFSEFAFEGRAQQAEAFASKKWEFLALTLGAQARIEKLTQADTTSGADDNVTTLSPYLQANFETGEKWFGGAGLRYNNHSVFGGQLNYSVGLGYRVLPELTLRGNLASAFQSPTLDQLYGPFGANPELNPQTSRSLEFGLAYGKPGTDHRASITVFQRKISDVIIFGNPGYLNRDELKDLGVEIEGTLGLTKSLRVNTNLTYVRGELSSQDFSGNPTTSEDFFRRPRLSGLIGMTYSPDFPLTVRLTTQYTGERPDLFFDADFNQFNVALDPYLLVNAYIEYSALKKENLTLFADLRNLTDTEFVEVTGFATQGVNGRFGARITL